MLHRPLPMAPAEGALHAPPLFIYGTLLDRDVLAVVTGLNPRRIRQEPARVLGHRAAPLRGRPYPILVRQAGAAAHGRLLHALSEEARRRIDFFEEGEAYIRERILARTATRSLHAQAYMAPPEMAGSAPWRLAEWRRRIKPRAMPWIRALMSHYGDEGAALRFDARWPPRA